MEKWARSKYQPAIGLGENGARVTGSREHIELSKNAAKEGMVLLKNEEQLLPLAKGTRVALFGKGTFDYVKGGGGSGDVYVAYIRNLYEGLKLQADTVEVLEKPAAFYREYVEAQYRAGEEPGMLKEPELSEELVKEARNDSEVAIISISRYSGEGWDRKAFKGEKIQLEGEGSDMIKKSEAVFDNGDFYLTEAEAAMAETVRKYYDKIIVVLNVGGVVDTQWFAEDEKIKSVLMAWQGGIEGGLAAAELLVGKGNPSGKLADTFARELSDYPAADTFHVSQKFVDYFEDIYVGYRYFETIPGKADRVVYPFGYGLSYTSFCLEDEKSVVEDGVVTVSVNVTNTGKKAGKEVIQVYASAPQGKLGKPSKVLAGYQKTRELLPGESQKIFISFELGQIASYDDLGKVAKSAYVLEKGGYDFYVGTSVREVVKAGETYQVEEDAIVTQLSEKVAPAALEKRLLADGSYEELPQRTVPDPDENIFELLTRTSDLYLVPADKARDPYVRWHPKTKPQLIDVANGKLSLDDFVKALPDKELAELLGGQPNTGVANTYGIGNLPEYGVPNIMTEDGPAGLRLNEETGVATTAWPCATLLACTWNPDVTEAIGDAEGKETKENNICVWLAPAINIHRSPLCGRNFEYYSEDPYLAGKQAAAMVRGVQSNHIATSVKHFALNNKETNRKDSDSRASERAIREIYLKAFEMVVKESQPWTIMSSYNIINGCRSSENRELLTDILRGEWGFKGMVTTDWWTYGEHYKEVNAGNDLKMAIGFPDRLLAAMEKGALKRETMEVSGKRILELILKME